MRADLHTSAVEKRPTAWPPIRLAIHKQLTVTQRTTFPPSMPLMPMASIKTLLIKTVPIKTLPVKTLCHWHLQRMCVGMADASLLLRTRRNSLHTTFRCRSASRRIRFILQLSQGTQDWKSPLGKSERPKKHTREEQIPHQCVLKEWNRKGVTGNQTRPCCWIGHEPTSAVGNNEEEDCSGDRHARDTHWPKT